MESARFNARLAGRTIFAGFFALLLAACGASEKPAAAPLGPGAATHVTSAPATPSAKCEAMLRRFGDTVMGGERDACVEAMSDGRERASCKERGKEADYDRCFESCMATVSLTAKDYDPGDVSSQPVANCRGGCGDTACK